MIDLNPDTPDAPVTVPASPVSDQAGSAVRDAMLILSALPTLIAVLGTHDVTKIVAYLSSAQFAPAAGVLATFGIVLWRQWITRHKHADAVKMASAAPNTVAVVK